VNLIDVYLGPAGMLTGSARLVQEARERATDLERKQAHERELAVLSHKEKALEAQKAVLESELKALEVRKRQAAHEFSLTKEQQAADRMEMAISRRVEETEGKSSVDRRKAG
jgi:circadian clock protein KaiC